MDVISYAVYPDGPSLLLSTKKSTFTFHMKKSVWTKRGKWVLPFAGKAHFDDDLGIFIGLSKDRETRGQLCSCDRASLNTDEWPAPDCKLCPEKLFSDNPRERHVSATLLYLGSKSKFCLVQCLFFEDVRTDQVIVEGGKDGGKHRRRQGCYMYRLTKFSLRNDKGNLMTERRRVQYFKVPEGTSRYHVCVNVPVFSLRC